MSQELRKLYVERLRESGLTESVAQTARLKPLSANETASLWEGAPQQLALQLPYLDPRGFDTSFFRIRLLGQVNGFSTQLAKPLRYLQPPSSGVRAYFPAVTGLDWMAVLRDPNAPLLITEGELKALAASNAGFPTIGLGGVNSWQSKAARAPLLEELAAINWEQRTVYLCYDSDAMTKPQVMEAAQQLAKELGNRGAVVRDATMPPIGEMEKVGLDDFLLKKGADGLEAHLAQALEFVSLKELRSFNERFVFVRQMSSVYEIKYSSFFDAGKFMNAVEAHAVYTVVHATKQGVKSEKRSVAKDWIQWPNRRQVQRIGYLPGKEQLEVTTEQDGTVLNLWRGWGTKPKRGDVRLWRTLFGYLTSGETEETRTWLERWLSYPIQQPGTKLYTAVALWGAQTGTGKTLLGETMIRIYGSNGQRIGAKQLASPYNSWAQRRQFIMGDEITGNDSRSHADELKGLLTGDWLRINEKYQPEYDLPNCVNFYFTSNHPDAFFLDDHDRRFLVLEAPGERLDQEFYREYHTWLQGEGPAALHYHLLHVNLGDFDPRAPALRTQAHEVMVEANRSDVGRFVAIVLHDSEQAQLIYKVPVDVDVFTAKELLLYYDPRSEKKVSERAVAMELQRQGAIKLLGGAQVRWQGHGRVRLFAVRNLPKWRRTDARTVRAMLMERSLPTPKF